MYVVRDIATGNQWTVSNYQRAEDKKNEMEFVFGPGRLVIEPIPGTDMGDIVAQLQDQLVDEQAAPGDYEGLAAEIDKIGRALPSASFLHHAAVLRAIAAEERRHYEWVQAILLDVQKEL